MRRLLFACLAVFLATGAARAGDYAEREIIGFSQEGDYFAFEEYGVQDGSGFPYSSIYIVDTRLDRWVQDTPIRVLIEDELATLEQVRAAARAQAAPLLALYGTSVAPRILVSNPITELGDHRSVDFLIRAFTPLQTQGWHLSLTEHALPSDCPDFGQPIVGFDLTLKGPDGRVREVHHDTSVPASRSCPLRYGVSDILAYDTPRGTNLIILLNVFSIGFEGPDRRFVAVPTYVTD